MKRSATLILIASLLLFGCDRMNSSTKKKGNVNPFTLTESLKLRSDKEMGLTWAKGTFHFRVFSPRATEVRLALFSNYRGEADEIHIMTRDDQGVWEYECSDDLWGMYYGYYVSGPSGKGEKFDAGICIADPYSEAVSTRNTYRHPGRSLILKNDFNWEGDTWLTPPDPRDLVIYEANLRDLTAHPSSGAERAGTYPGLTEADKKGGLNYLKSLGINAVEFLPLQDFGNMEIPYQQPVDGVTNTWNPYARNHWGYMTSYFFAPESYYASGGTMKPGAYSGTDGRQARELKTLVKTLHREGISVLMDVVYNHVSQYDYNPLRYIDNKYYFRLDKNFGYLSVSGCGNDFRTEAPMARKLIVDSILYWMKTYHIDGFRFDLAAMIDEKTLKLIRDEAKKLNPNVVIIAEPWGGGYMPARFSELGWASWNDKFRNGIKGQNPHDRLGFIFGKWDEDMDRDKLFGLLTGSLKQDSLTYQNSRHAVNYLESHDDLSFGDFVRLAIGKNTENEVITDLDQHSLLTPQEMHLNKLGAFILAGSQGIMMMHAGQEFARSQVIWGGDVPDPRKGMIDNNSYNKDDETNYINYHTAALNKNLVNYYRGLIKMREGLPELRRADRNACEPVYSENTDFALGVHILPQDDLRECYVLCNASAEKTALFELGNGYWDVYADDAHADSEPIRKGIMGQTTVAPQSGMILIRH